MRAPREPWMEKYFRTRPRRKTGFDGVEIICGEPLNSADGKPRVRARDWYRVDLLVRGQEVLGHVQFEHRGHGRSQTLSFAAGRAVLGRQIEWIVRAADRSP